VKRWMMMMAAVGLTLLVAGCGNSNEAPASKAFGGLSDADVAALQDWSAQFRDIVDQNITVAGAFTDENIPGSQRAVDKFADMVSDAQDEIIEFESGELQDALSDYMIPYEDLANAYERWVTYFSEPGPADPATENDILADIQQAVRDSRQADRVLLRRLTSVLDDEQRKQFLTEIRQYSDEMERKADLATGQ